MFDRVLIPLVLVLGVTSLALFAEKRGLERDIAEMQLAWEKAAAESARKAREREHQLLAEIDAIAADYEKQKQDLEDEHQALVADLRAGNVRLRRLWQGCETATARVPTNPTTAGQPDGEADDRAESAGRIVRAAAACDAQVAGLQSYIQAALRNH